MSLSAVIVGAGNMAYHLATNLHRSNVVLKQICNRTSRGLDDIQQVTGIDTADDLYKIYDRADVYILAVSDDAIVDVAAVISSKIPSSAVMAHTSGSQSIDILKGYCNYYGAFYPLQSFKKDRAIDFSKIPIFISSHQQQTLDQLKAIAVEITHDVITISDEHRAKLHIPAVYVNNFVNHLYSITADYCEQEGLKIDYLYPLMRETLERITEGAHPQDMQTGPAIRGDKTTVSNHRSLLRKYPIQKRIYNYFTSLIRKYYEDN